jgi:hypothetical protein
MAREIVYLVQGFTEKSGALRGDKPVVCKTAEAAIRTAQRIGSSRVGAVAFSSSGDAELGDYDDNPVILAVVGRVPEEFLQ